MERFGLFMFLIAPVILTILTAGLLTNLLFIKKDNNEYRGNKSNNS